METNVYLTQEHEQWMDGGRQLAELDMGEISRTPPTLKNLAEALE